MSKSSRRAQDNRANQLNPNNVLHAASRGESTASPESSNLSPAKPE